MGVKVSIFQSFMLVIVKVPKNCHTFFEKKPEKENNIAIMDFSYFLVLDDENLFWFSFAIKVNH